MTKLSKFYADSGPERIGFVLDDGKIVECENIHPEPEQGFEFRAEDLIEFENRAVASWHTHPNQDSNLSMSDYSGFRHWPKLKHYVIGNDGIRCFKVERGKVVEDE